MSLHIVYFSCIHVPGPSKISPIPRNSRPSGLRRRWRCAVCGGRASCSPPTPPPHTPTFLCSRKLFSHTCLVLLFSHSSTAALPLRCPPPPPPPLPPLPPPASASMDAASRRLELVEQIRSGVPRNLLAIQTPKPALTRTRCSIFRFRPRGPADLRRARDRHRRPVAEHQPEREAAAKGEVQTAYRIAYGSASRSPSSF
jgi:hypothetical protein